MGGRGGTANSEQRGQERRSNFEGGKGGKERRQISAARNSPICKFQRRNEEERASSAVIGQDGMRMRATLKKKKKNAEKKRR